MKKLALILAMLLIPCAAFGLEMLTDNTLDEVTGQSGVSIAADDIQIFLNVDRFAYIDCDGYGTSTNYGGTCESSVGAGFVVNNFQMDVININMIGTAGAQAQIVEGSSGIALGTAFNTASDGSWYIYEGTAYSVVGDDDTGNGTRTGTFYRNPGHQSVYGNPANPTGYGVAAADSNGVYVDDGSYNGSLALASATCGNIPLFYDYANNNTSGGCHLDADSDATTASTYGLNNYTNTNYLSADATFHPQALTIDLSGALPLFTSGLHQADPGTQDTVGGVLIGLPTMEIHIQEILIGEMVITADISSNTQAEQDLVHNNNESFGAIQLEGVTMTILGGWMEIAPNVNEWGPNGGHYVPPTP